MTGILPRLLACLLLTFPPALFALGLGDIRLKSALNEPLDAEIELVSASPDELSSLRAALASRETFVRYGLERPVLPELEFRVGKSGDGRNVLFVRSRQSIADPFLTFLIEVNWSRGRLLREYTVLLDPPVYMPGAQEARNAPVTAPQAGESQTTRSGQVSRPEAPVSEPAPSGGVSRPSAPAIEGNSYTVRRNDTLYQIASGLKPGSSADVNRMMIALYRANPEAFQGNINQLRAGAILRVPDTGDYEAIAASDANAEVRRQYSEWRGSRAAGPSAEGGEAARLRLVTPTGPGEGAGSQQSAQSAAETQQLRDKVSELEGQLAEQRRLLELKNAELARLQAEGTQAQPPAETQVPPAQPPEATAPTEGAPTAETPPPQETTPTEATPPVTEPQATPPQPETTPATTPAPAAEEPGLIAGVIDWVLANWYIPAGALLLLIAIIFGLSRRRRQEPDFGALGRLASSQGPAARTAPRMDREVTTQPIRAPKPKDDDAFTVEEGADRTSVRPSRASTTAELPRVVEKPRVEARSKSDETLSSETAINLDQGDPLAEADFHMAYGLYDQAADLVRIAIERDPQRRDLKLKLLEIFFVWGNKDSFLQMARQLGDSRSDAAAGEWDKIAIMGRQIAPDDPMFAPGAGGGGGGGGDVDLNLEGGENRVDLDVLGAPEGERGGGIDLDLGGVLGDEDEATATTGESPAMKDDEGIDFVLDDTGANSVDGSSTTREMPARGATMEVPTVESPAYRSSEVPTVESPALRERGSSTIKEKIDSALFRKDAVSSDQTAELALDDLGLDLGSLRDAESQPLESMEATDHPADAATMLAGVDDRSRRLIEEADRRTRALQEIERVEQSPTGTWVLDDKTLAATVALPGASGDLSTTDRVRALADAGSAGDTARRRRLDVDSTAEISNLSGGDDMGLDLDRLEQALKSDTVKQGRTEEDQFSTDVFNADSTDSNIDVDVGAVHRDRDREPTGTARIPVEEMMPELEPVTMSEVGTKLDLARAYMDMGDPEGARSILDEVLQEGSATQKQEAQRLIDSLPG